MHNVYHKKDAIWSFTVVGRPPQEDTSFGALIHEITGSALPQEIHGLKEVNAVDAAGVHPLLFAIGSERYTPYLGDRKPQEILTIANHILGKNQLSLAKYLFIAAREDDESLNTNDLESFLKHMLSRIDFRRDVHFYTQTTIDTLDYSGEGLNAGSKVVFAAAGAVNRTLTDRVPVEITWPTGFSKAQFAMSGVMVLQLDAYSNESEAALQMELLNTRLSANALEGVALIVVVDNADFTAASMNNLVWVTFTRSNPAADIYGIEPFTKHKHWGCNGPLIIDARKKPHHAPELIKDPATEEKINRFKLQ